MTPRPELLPSPDRWTWRCVVIGGGPGAALQVTQLLRTGQAAPSEILVVSDQWGAPGMDFLGGVRLQSYLSELELGWPALPLRSYTCAGSLQPTGAEYDRYAREVLERSGVTRWQGRVQDVRRAGTRFVLSVRTAAGQLLVRTPRVVLATGARQRPAPPGWQDTGIVVHSDQAFRDVASGHLTPYASRSALVVGSGNSALQIAALLAPICQQVTVLATKHLGMYPRETDDRFAWRAASQLTWELVVKSSGDCRVSDGMLPCLRFLVYRTLTAADGSAVVTYCGTDNEHQMGRHSLLPQHRHARASRLVGHDDHWREEWPLTELVVVWATGREPVYPACELLDSLPRDDRGVLLTDEHGQLPVPGLFLTGSCAGQRAVNEMVPARTAAGDHPAAAGRQRPPAISSRSGEMR